MTRVWWVSLTQSPWPGNRLLWLDWVMFSLLCEKGEVIDSSSGFGTEVYKIKEEKEEE